MDESKTTTIPMEEKQLPPSIPPVPQMSNFTRLGMCVAGIMGFFVLYGILQERIMTKPYGTDENGEPIYFKQSTFLVLSNRVFAAMLAVCILLYRGQSLKNIAPLHKYMGVSASNFSATWCQYEALKYVNFPTQTLGKCGKMLPVMLVGTFLSGKKYTTKDYLMALSITFGCMIFLMTGDISSHTGSGNTPFGLALMAAYMFFDGFTSTFQEKMFKGYTMSTYDQMVYVNLFSALVSFIVMIFQQNVGAAIEFATTYPQLLWDSTLLSVCATFGQMVIYYTIKEFGALVFSTIMVTRQVVSIVLSCLIYLHPLSMYQWLGFFLVFGTLYYKEAENKKKHGSPKH